MMYTEIPLVQAGMIGRQLTDRLLSSHPERKVLHMAGHITDVVTCHRVSYSRHQVFLRSLLRRASCERC